MLRRGAWTSILGSRLPWNLLWQILATPLQDIMIKVINY